jgi:hypothetical protein
VNQPRPQPPHAFRRVANLKKRRTKGVLGSHRACARTCDAHYCISQLLTQLLRPAFRGALTERGALGVENRSGISADISKAEEAWKQKEQTRLAATLLAQQVFPAILAAKFTAQVPHRTTTQPWESRTTVAGQQQILRLESARQLLPHRLGSRPDCQEDEPAHENIESGDSTQYHRPQALLPHPVEAVGLLHPRPHYGRRARGQEPTSGPLPRPREDVRYRHPRPRARV